MNEINMKIKEAFPDASVMKSTKNNAYFKGRNLPSFVRDYVLRRYTDSEGNVDEEALTRYLTEKMPTDISLIKTRLSNIGETVNITTRFITSYKEDINKTEVNIPDLNISKAYISDQLAVEQPNGFYDGEHWGNISLEYEPPMGKKPGCYLVTKYVSFAPYYNIDLDYFKEARQKFTLDEWIDTLITTMEYNSDAYSQEQKLELISRLMPFVEPRLNMIELGPKGTGKSYVYNNLSKYAWLISGGISSRAQMFYNIAKKQFGVMKYYDAVGIDEITTFKFSDDDQMRTIFKAYLEAGNTKVDKINFKSECGLIIMGNIPLNKDMKPQHSNYVSNLPDLFCDSATMDRFHGFNEGWKIPRLNTGHIMEGWTLNTEYFSTIMHMLRTTSEYDEMFGELVQTDKGCDIRDKKAVKKMTVAYHKLLFPHITSMDDIAEEDRESFKALYKKYCLDPAVYRRQIIRNQCYLIDKEYKQEMSNYNVV